MNTKNYVFATLATLTLLTHAFGGTIPEGNYVGHGLFKSQTNKGRYSVENKIHANMILSSYTLDDGSHKEWAFTMVPTQNGFFTVQAYGTNIGQGYCLEQAQVCHYEIKVGKLTLEETLTFMNGKLYRFGSKDTHEKGTGRIFWQEGLDLDTNKE